MAFTIAMSNEKGGVAKTTSTLSLGAALAELNREHGRRIGRGAVVDPFTILTVVVFVSIISFASLLVMRRVGPRRRRDVRRLRPVQIRIAEELFPTSDVGEEQRADAADHESRIYSAIRGIAGSGGRAGHLGLRRDGARATVTRPPIAEGQKLRSNRY